MASADDAGWIGDGTGNDVNNSLLLQDNTTRTLDAPEVERFIEASILSFFCFLALFGNISLWIIILRDRNLRNQSNALILCLSTADILVSAVNMPIIVYTLVKGRWVFSDMACQALGFMTMLTFVASVMSLGTISFNRYIHICQHHRFSTMYTWRNTGFFFLGTWLLSVGLSMPPLLGWAHYGYLPGQSFCFCDWKSSISYTFFMVLVCFGGPCSAMTFCYVRIMQKVRESKRKIQAFTTGNKNVPPPTPSGMSSTSFSDSSNPKEEASVSQTPRSSFVSRRKRFRNDSSRSKSKNGSVRSQRPISINSQTDIDTHFAPRGYLTSSEKISDSASGKWVEEDKTSQTFSYRQMNNPRESIGAISDISHKVPFDENLHRIALDDGEYSICSDSMVGRGALAPSSLPAMLGNVSLNSTQITEVPDDLPTGSPGHAPRGEFSDSVPCSPVHESSPYKYSPIINLRSPVAGSQPSEEFSNINEHRQLNYDNKTQQNRISQPISSTSTTSSQAKANTIAPRIEVISPSLEPTNKNNNSKTETDKSSSQFLKPPGSAQVQILAEASRKSRRQLLAIRRKQDEIRMTITLLVVIFVFIICWLPFCIAMFWYVFSDSPVPRPFNMTTLLMGCMNSSCNPIIYGLMNRKFKKAFIGLYCACCPRRWNWRRKDDSLSHNSS